MYVVRFCIFALVICGWGYPTCKAQSASIQNLNWLTADERDFLEKHPVITVAPTPDYPPFEYWSPKANGEYEFKGVVSSYLKHFESELGIKFEMIRTERWADNLEGLKSREIDAVSLLVPWTDRTFVKVSEPYISYPAVIIVQKSVTEDLSLKDLNGKKVAVPDNYTGEAFLRQNYPDIDVVEVIDPADGVRKLAAGEVCAFFGGSAVVAYMGQREGINNLRIAGESDFMYQNGFAIRSDWGIFADIISKTLKRIPAGQRSAFHEEWISDGFFQKKFYEYAQFWWGLGFALSTLVVGTVGMIFWNRRQAAFIEQLEAEKQRTEVARLDAEAANEAKSSFVAMISHEIRTPMNGVLGMCELLRATGLDTQQSEYLDFASGSAENMVELINDLLDFSKMEAGKLELDLQPFSLERLLKEVIALMRTQTDRKGLTLSVDRSENLSSHYLGDSLRIRQVLLNLLGNAIKFTDNGSVTVRVSRDENKSKNPETETDIEKIETDQIHRLRFTVEDTGIGVAPEKLATIFEPFKQEETSTTRRYGGTGLGLSICKTLAQMMGGDAFADSTLGQGSTFGFSAALRPTRETEDAQEPGWSSAVGDAPTRSRRVLLAEDTVVNQKVAEGLLTRRGHHVEIATTGIEALEAMQKTEYDAVLMDIEMPEMDGITAVSKLRDREKKTGKHQWVVAITGHAMVGDRERFMAAGMDAHLVKPFKPVELYAAVEGVIPKTRN
jgi:signal transduction histidine kinase/CheY-like chemotaxis protein